MGKQFDTEDSGTSRGKENARGIGITPNTGSDTNPATGEVIQRADSTAPAAPSLRAYVQKFLTKKEQLLNQQVEGAIQSFGAGTGLARGIGSGFTIAPQEKIAKIIKELYGTDIPSDTLGVSTHGRGGAAGQFCFAKRGVRPSPHPAV